MKSFAVALKHRRTQAQDRRQSGGTPRLRIPFVYLIVPKGEPQ